jgi:flagellar protein FliO/FliZ
MDLETYFRFILALIAVLALIGGIAWLLRRSGFAPNGGNFGAGRTRRLNVVESLNIDGKRRLLLIRRDGVEHLVLLGATTDLVIEPGIHTASAAQPAKTA